MATILGGGPASGKSTVVEGETFDNTVKIDVDKIRKDLPEYRERVGTDPSVSDFTHEESSDIAKEITREALGNNRNVLLDGTGDSTIEKLGGKTAAMRYAGHEVVARYVTVDTDTALARAIARAEKPGPDHGRHVPETFLRETHANVSRIVPEAIRQGLFDKFELHDTSGSTPTHVASAVGSQLTIHDQAAWDRFIAKGKQ